jgi:hypothetical protein
VVSDGRDRCLKPRDVRFEGDRYFVAEAPLHSGADGAEQPRRGGGEAQADGGRNLETGSPFDDATAEQHEPQRKQGVGQRRELR